MTIEEIKITAEYCFGESPLILKELGNVNFIFAPNGSGKTTISSVLDSQPIEIEQRLQWEVAQTELPIRVFNEEYRSKVLAEYVNGIFTIGEDSKEANDEINNILDQKRERGRNRENWKTKIGHSVPGEAATGLLGDLESENILARDLIFDAHRELKKTIIEFVFKGFRSKRDSFFNEALRRAADLKKPDAEVSWDSIEARIRSLEGDRQARSPLPQVLVSSLVTEAERSEVVDSGESKGTGALTELIRHLSNEDWVSGGRAYLDKSDGACPFCQQALPHDFRTLLTEYFAGGFDDARDRSFEIKRAVEERSKTLGAELASLEKALGNDGYCELEAFTREISSIRTAATLLLTRLDEKCASPTQPVEIFDVKERVERLAALIDEENKRIEEHNEIIANFKNERESVVNDGWSLFLCSKSVDKALNRYNGIKTKKNAEIKKFRDLIDESFEQDSEDERAISDLKGAISNTSEVADRINKLLKSMGFHRFRITVDDIIAGGYRIVREDGSLAFESLSEGERSFLCFAYYWESLFGSSDSSGNAEDVIAVVDDPISSLDSDALFTVASYIRHAASMVVDGSSNLRQLIVLTHNTQFHHEAAYLANRAKVQDRHYFRLLKGVDGVSLLVDDKNVSRIRGTYPLLWESVTEAARNEEESSLVQVGIFNIVRRIIEGYFRTIGKVADYDQPEGLSVADQRMISVFHMWASSGSHTIADDMDQTVDVGGSRNFLKLFRKYFEVVGHSSHFAMMLRASGGEELARPGAIFDPAAY